MRENMVDFGISKEQTFYGWNSSVKETYDDSDPDYLSANTFYNKT